MKQENKTRTGQMRQQNDAPKETGMNADLNAGNNLNTQVNRGVQNNFREDNYEDDFAFDKAEGDAEAGSEDRRKNTTRDDDFVRGMGRYQDYNRRNATGQQESFDENSGTRSGYRTDTERPEGPENERMVNRENGNYEKGNRFEEASEQKEDNIDDELFHESEERAYLGPDNINQGRQEERGHDTPPETPRH